MVKITYSPVEELVVHEVVEVSLEDLLRQRITPQGNLPLYWCDGILFSFSSLPITNDTAKEYLNGKIHWLEVHYSKMEKYKEILSLEDEAYKSTVHVRVIDTCTSSLHKAFVKWLKGMPK